MRRPRLVVERSVNKPVRWFARADCMNGAVRWAYDDSLWCVLRYALWGGGNPGHHDGGLR